MSIFDEQEKPYEFIKSTPSVIGSVQHFSQATFGAGESSIIQLDSEAAKFGGRTLTDAKAYIKTDGTYKFKDASGNDILTNLGLQVSAISNLLSIQGWTSDLTFSASDNDTVAWTLGTIKLTDGTTFSIVAGNTGNMSATTYIYFDKAVSETVLQTTTTAATAVGANKILIAVAGNVAVGKLAEFQVFGGKGGVSKLITADNIAASTITANEIAANTITSNKLSVSQLSAIAADLGSITAGTITGTILQTASSGYRIKVNGSNNKIELLSDSTVQSSIYNDASAKLTLDTLDSIVFRRSGTGYITFNYESSRSCMDIELATDSLVEWSSGRYIKGESSQVVVGGDFVPSGDNQYKCGTSGRRWSVGNFEDIVVDDITVNNSFGGCGSISGCAYNEINLLSKEEKDNYKLYLNTEKSEKKKFDKFTQFEKGDVLSWGINGLKKVVRDCCPCVMAIADEKGLPIVLGAEPIKVIGKVAVNQFLVTSCYAGYARGWDKSQGEPPRGTVIAQAMANKTTDEAGMVMAMIRKF